MQYWSHDRLFSVRERSSRVTFPCVDVHVTVIGFAPCLHWSRLGLLRVCLCGVRVGRVMPRSWTPDALYGLLLDNGGGAHWMTGGEHDVHRLLRDSEYAMYSESGCGAVDDGVCSSVAFFSRLQYTRYLAQMALVRTLVVVAIMVFGVAIITYDAEKLVRVCVSMATANRALCTVTYVPRALLKSWCGVVSMGGAGGPSH